MQTVIQAFDPFGVSATYGEPVARIVGFLLAAVVVLAVGRLVVTPTVLRVVSARNRDNRTIQTATETYLHAAVLFLTAVAGLAGAGYGGVLADSALVIAAVTLVVGVAGREVLGSLVSGLFLVADRDFNVGDWIAWPDGEGIIEAVDFRVTRVRTPSNETVAVPNTELTNNTLVRPYGRDRYRITERLDVAYADDAELALMTLSTTAGEDERVLEEPAPTARIVEFGGNALALQAEFWIADPMDVDLFEVKSDFRRRVKRRFDEEGLTLGPPAGREVSGELSVEGGATAEGSG